jgi:hypothetical protein
MMKNLAAKIQENLILEYDQLLYPSIEYLKNNWENYTRVSFDSVGTRHPPDFLDMEKSVNVMLDSKRDIENLKITKGSVLGKSFAGNEIQFPFSMRMPPLPRWGSQEFDRYREWRNALEFSCQSEFLEKEGKEKELAPLIDFEIFDDRIFDSSKVEYYKWTRKFFFNTKGWGDFIHRLFGKYFPDYAFSPHFSNKRIKRYLVELEGGYLFGFEYDEQDIKKEVRRDDLNFGDYFNIVLIEPVVKKSRISFVAKSEAVLQLGILGNPFFYEPCYPLRGYSAGLKADLSRRGVPSFSEVVDLGNDKFQVVHPRAYGDDMKRHACFYIDVLADTSSVYLHYLKVAITKSLAP